MQIAEHIYPNTSHTVLDIRPAQRSFDFEPQEEADLHIRKGAIVKVLEKSDHQWRKGSCKGKQGPFRFHQAFPDDALNVRHMNVRPGGAQPALRDIMGKEGTENAVG